MTTQRVKVKICGITRPEDGIAAADAGADAVGLVFYSGSPRKVNLDTASRIIEILPPFITKIGLFVNEEKSNIKKILSIIPIDIIQFHGDETPAQCAIYGKPYIKAVRMHEDIDLNKIEGAYTDAVALLLDTYIQGVAGGTGQKFDWDRIPAGLRKPIILAGGLTAKNVRQAIQQVQPYAVDVSGGVESDYGIKDKQKIYDFIKEVNRA